jgi:Mrp family chromosome partitioning ATPase
MNTIRNWGMTMFPISLLFSACVGWWCYFFYAPEYKAELNLRISADETSGTTIVNANLLSQELAVLHSPQVLERVLEQSTFRALPELMSPDPLQALQQQLYVQPVQEPLGLNLIFHSQSKQGAELLLLEVAQAYKEYRFPKQQLSSPVIDILQLHVSRHNTEIERLHEIIKDLSQNVGIAYTLEGDRRESPPLSETQQELIRQSVAAVLLEAQIQECKETINESAQLNDLQQQFETANQRIMLLQEQWKREFASQPHAIDALHLELAQQNLMLETELRSQLLSHLNNLRGGEPTNLQIQVSKPATARRVDSWSTFSLASVIAAFVFPWMFLFLHELFYHRLYSLDDLQKIVPNLPVLGVISSFKTNKIPNFETSVQALQQTWLEQQSIAAGVILLTSSKGCEGKSSLAAQLALCLASKQRAATLLIDAAWKHPVQHKLFHIPLSSGIGDLLANASLDMQPVTEHLPACLSLLPWGNVEGVPTRHWKTRWEQFLIYARERYTFIVIDAPAILQSPDSLFFAQSADTTLLCVRPRISCGKQVTLAHQRLQAAGVTKVSAVVIG